MNNRFEKVSYGQFQHDMKMLYHDFPSDGLIERIYESIQLPKRSTIGSAGYDFFLPFGIDLHHKSSIVIPTGVKCKLKSDRYLMLCPRSSLGFKYNLKLANTVGIIDSDYYNNETTEGHILVKLEYDGFDTFTELISVITNNPGEVNGLNFQCVEGIKDKEGDIIYNPHNQKSYNPPLVLKQGDKFVQGIIMRYYTMDDDFTSYLQGRTGGIGSTGN